MRRYMLEFRGRWLAAVMLAAGAMLLPGHATAADAYKTQTGSPAGTYKIDPVHSLAQFWIGHLGVSELPGRFDKISGSFTFDPAHPENSKVSVEIPVKSLDTNYARRNKDLRGPDFFNARQFPIMKFVSTKLIMGDDNEMRLAGQLTLHGVTQPVTFNLRHVGAGPDPWGNYRSGYIASAIIRRSHFGMNYMLGGISDQVKIQLNIEGKRQ
ncbi:MAG TPA: YceI family protein [Mariprofundaceae bacterium]|nr:YceI family protein [Mariprofundaceae bacterium]